MNQDLQDYLDLVNKRRQEQKPLELTMPSGAVWKYTPINMAQYAASGRLPTHLAGKLKAGTNGQVTAPKLSDEELADIGLKALEVVRDVMLNNLVFPKISLTGEPETIAPEQLDPEDFQFFTQFVMSGGQASQDSFRQPDNRKRK